MKRFLSLCLSICMMFTLAACTDSQTSTNNGEDAPKEANYKIGIITGSISQNEEEYQAAQDLKEAYPDIVVTATYPDYFSTETEKTIAVATNLAADQDVKAILFVQAVPGVMDAIDKIKETRDDILFICGASTDDPSVIAEKADICLLADEIAMGTTIIQQIKKQGAKTFVHISFERHRGYSLNTERQELFKSNCEANGIKYIEATAPDPTGDAGVMGAQAWITEKIKDFVHEYGNDTAFFCTNCSMQSTLIQQCAELGAIYPLQCCPSPYHGYPTAFDISTDGHEDDIQYILDQIAVKVTDYGNEGRMSTWSVPVNALMIKAGFQYASKWLEGEITERCDAEALADEIQALAGEDVTITNYVDETSGEVNNFFLISCPFYDF